MPTTPIQWFLPQIDRKTYLICTGLLILISALLPASFLFVGGPAGWLLLFSARVRYIGKKAWMGPALFLVGVEMFGRETIGYLGRHSGASAAGYFVIALIIAHFSFLVVLAFQHRRPGRALV